MGVSWMKDFGEKNRFFACLVEWKESCKLRDSSYFNSST